MSMLVGLGNPLLDISADVPEALLQKYDLKLNNSILSEPKHLPLYEEMSVMPNVKFIAGGACQNTIRVGQWMMQTPKSSAYIGCVGQDKYAQKLRESAEGDGVEVHYMVNDKLQSGTCACLINQSERSLVANVSAAASFQPSFLQTAEVQAVLAKAKIFYVEGFFFTSSNEAVLELAQYAHAHNQTFALNLSACFLPQFFMDRILAALPYVDFLFGNESEALAFAEQQKFEHKDIASIAKQIAAYPSKKGSRYVVITQGSKSTVIAHDGQVTEYSVPPLDAKLIVDTNGAGDAFVGGFLSQLMKNAEIATCVKAGNYAASVILQVSGTALTGKPTFSA